MIGRQRRRVLIVDDSAFVRRAFRRVLRDESSIAVVGEAADGLSALAQVQEVRPDVVLLDLGMPGMDGLSVLQRLRTSHPHVAVVVVSAATQAGAEMTVRALEAGAFDFVDKSSVSTMDLHTLKDALVERILASHPTPELRVGDVGLPPRSARGLPALICIGASTGGPQAITWIAQRLRPTLPCPVVVVQHIAPSFVPAFAARLDETAGVPARVATPGAPLAPGTLYVAPGGADMEVAFEAGALVARSAPSLPRALHAPTVDRLFHSAAQVVGPKAVGILLTGMGRDGAEGLLAMRRAGGFTLAEHASSCAVYGMPRAAIELGAASAVLPLHAIPAALQELAGGIDSPAVPPGTP